jgi:hypothetical protein
MSRRARRRVEVRFGPGGPTFLGYSRNLSRTGMMIGTLKVFAPGTILDLRLTLGDQSVCCRAEVIWAREGSVQWMNHGRVGMGIRFLGPPPALPLAAVQ